MALKNTRDLRNLEKTLKEFKEKKIVMDSKKIDVTKDTILRNTHDARIDIIQGLVNNLGYELSMRILRSNLF